MCKIVSKKMKEIKAKTTRIQREIIREEIYLKVTQPFVVSFSILRTPRGWKDKTERIDKK